MIRKAKNPGGEPRCGSTANVSFGSYVTVGPLRCSLRPRHDGSCHFETPQEPVLIEMLNQLALRIQGLESHAQHIVSHVCPGDGDDGEGDEPPHVPTARPQAAAPEPEITAIWPPQATPKGPN